MYLGIRIKGKTSYIPATLLEGGLAQILALPTMVAPDINDWGDEDGVEVDTLQPSLLEPLELSLPLWFSPSCPLDEILASPSVTLSAGYGADDRITFEARPVRVEELEKTPRGWAGILICRRTEDVPKPTGAKPWSDLVTVLDGSLSTGVYLAPERKEDVRVSDPTTGTHFFDGVRTFRGAYKLDLPVLLTGDRLLDIWRKRTELLAQLAKSGLRDVPALGEGARARKGYYSSSSAKDAYPTRGDRGYRMALTISLTITNV